MDLDELRLPSDASLWVKMRRKILWGDEIAVESAVLASRGQLQGVAALKRQRVFQLIEGWNLHLAADGTVGPQGQPLPMAPAALDHLEPQDGEFLYEYARHRFEHREDIANPFVPGSEMPSPAASSRRSSRRSSS